MGRTKIKRRVKIDAPKAKVWKALADFGNVYKISKGVVSSHSTSKKKNGVGATRHCDLVNMGAQVDERITKWKEGEYMNIEIFKTKKTAFP